MALILDILFKKFKKYKKYLNCSVLQVRRYFDKADKNKDGKLSKEEWHSVLNCSGVPTTR